MTTNDLDLAREVADTIAQSPNAYDQGMQATARVIASLPDEWIDANKLREALDWRDSKPSGYTHPYDGEFYDRLRDLLPPALPDPLFGARATHPDWGEGIVFSHHPDEDGTVRIMFPYEDSGDGTLGRWVNPHTLTFRTQETPEVLETEEDYENAPEGTIITQDDHRPFVLIDALWRQTGTWARDHDNMVGIRRRVLRWGWEA